ncbi:SDR family NAD(P)-dependent oxidoreductase [Sphingobium limneticum]|jgi:NAD(P)-dependent dehydrogenase (short-subunit alcohol dehydrogenase family)|uniref:SDR family NAD(P)-dependent oxidoreductase n=1 Tax=Sphingobium limneticum TaxID=1007511 RepID=UPI003CFC0497
MFDLTGKVAIVTGAGSGIGAAIAQRFRAAGADVLVADISPQAEVLALQWGCTFRRTDVGQPDEMAALCEGAIARFGKLDILVNNAGIAASAPIAEADEARSQRFWRVHILGVQMGIKEAAARMTAGGAIVNISSITAMRGFLQWGEYAATKAGIISLTQTAAVEYGPRGIRVNCIAPGIIDTPMAMDEAPDMVSRNANVFTLLGRIGRPEELAAAVHFMASDDASYITGQTLLVDGGWSTGTSIKGIELALSTTG